VKSAIIELLGEKNVLLPELIAEGLAANDRIKARLSVLQAAADHACDPQNTRFSLSEECRAAGIDPVPLEAMVNGASRSSGERITAPGLGALGKGIWDDMAAMLHAVKAGDPALGEKSADRLAAIQGAASLGSSDSLETATPKNLTSLPKIGEDSLHRLIMDLHKALNGLAASHAQEVISGALTYGLLAQDRAAVEAFMRGLNATRKLKFDHPGLATTATRAAERLTIQNDIGETDAHVVVITINPDNVTVIYSDVHRARARFFVELLDDFSAQWSGLERKTASALADDGTFYLVTGRCSAPEGEARNAFLEAIGASLVFLIDWNKARKVLREWVRNGDAVHILDWAARHRVGHRGFLELGGPELVASAIHDVAAARIGFGDRLDNVLGRDGAVDFLKAVLRASSEALLAGCSMRLARDRIEAALVAHLQRVDAGLLAIVIRQAGLARDIAASLADVMTGQRTHWGSDAMAVAKRAQFIEQKADRIVIEARSEIARFDADPGIERLTNEIENAIDELEQAAFVASLVPAGLPSALVDPLIDLCAAAVCGTEAAVIGAAAAAEVPEGHRVDTEDVLAAVGRLIECEHRGDAAERAVTANVISSALDLKTALSVLELARALERATDRLATFGHLLRDHVLADLST
jgi:uncharacterized protein Yka (UPF0111/DUF47 family)